MSVICLKLAANLVWYSLLSSWHEGNGGARQCSANLCCTRWRETWVFCKFNRWRNKNDVSNPVSKGLESKHTDLHRIFTIFPDPLKSLFISAAHLQTYQSVSIKHLFWISFQPLTCFWFLQFQQLWSTSTEGWQRTNLCTLARKRFRSTNNGDS